VITEPLTSKLAEYRTVRGVCTWFTPVWGIGGAKTWTRFEQDRRPTTVGFRCVKEVGREGNDAK
jgi:hypothetical protein